MSKHQQRGFILLNTIIIAGLLGLLVVSQTDRVLLYYKAQNQLQAHHNALEQLEAAAQQVLASHQDLACMIAAIEPNQIVRQIKKQQGCSLVINKQSYVFILEDLGAFPCLQTRLYEQVYSTKHIRLTIAARMKKSMVLQLRVAQARPVLACRSREPSASPLGVISWRILW